MQLRNIRMNIKLFTIVFFGAFGLTIVSSIIGNILEARGILTEKMIGSKGVTAVLAFYFALFCVMVFSVVVAHPVPRTQGCCSRGLL